MCSPEKGNFLMEAFKHRDVVDPKYAEERWKVIEDAIDEIYNHNNTGSLSLRFEELYRDTPALCFLWKPTRLTPKESDAGKVPPPGPHTCDRSNHHPTATRVVNSCLEWGLNLRLFYGKAFTWNACQMVLNDFGEELYSGLVSTMTAHLKRIATTIEASQGALFLEELDKKCTTTLR
ncbi:cullin-3B-like [Rutidosis leptorrhynchoides]|uniref:cullin-3B-like n=1 Tax=Rutidosis leptorrhynchoides TaxID=125765 RepID=UPI003A9938E8